MRLRNRIITSAGLVVLILGGVSLTLWVAAPQDPLAVACDQIKEGMLTEDAVAIVGRPRDSGGTEWHVSKGDPRGLEFHEWFGKDCKLHVCSWQGRVVSKEYVSWRQGIVDRLRRRLGL